MTTLAKTGIFQRLGEGLAPDSLATQVLNYLNPSHKGTLLA